MTIEISRDTLCDIVAANNSAAGGRNVFNGLCIEAAEVSGGELFVSLRSDRKAEELAFSRGAAFVLTANDSVAAAESTTAGRIITVPEVSVALWTLVQWWVRERDVPLLCVAGKVGKTSIKEYIARILISRHRGTYTRASQNDPDRVAETLCRIGVEDAWAVIEVSDAALETLLANEINITTLVALDENVLPVRSAWSAGVAPTHIVIPHAVAPGCEARVTGMVHTYGLEPEASVSVSKIQVKSVRATEFLLTAGSDTAAVFMTVAGTYCALNAAVAVCAVRSVFPDLTLSEISVALRNTNAVAGRLHIHRLPGERYLFDDTVHATLASLDPLLDVAGHALRAGLAPAVICGDLDVGAKDEHEQFAEKLAALQPSVIVACGTFAELMVSIARSRGVRAMVAATPDACAHTVRKFPWQVLFVKSGQKQQLKRTVTILLEAEGEVLEIPDDLTHFGSMVSSEE